MLDVDALIEEATAAVKAAEDNFNSFCDGRPLQGDVFARLLRVHPLLEASGVVARPHVRSPDGVRSPNRGSPQGGPFGLKTRWSHEPENLRRIPRGWSHPAENQVVPWACKFRPWVVP